MIGPWQIAIVALLIIVLFGRGKIANMMGELGRGITSFKKGLKADETDGKDEPVEQVSDKSDAEDKDA